MVLVKRVVLMRCEVLGRSEVLESKMGKEKEESFPELDAFMRARGRARMSAIARKHCPESMVDDAVQESLTTIWLARGKYDPTRGEFSPWAAKIVMRCAMRISQRPGWRMSANLLDEELDACEDTAIAMPEPAEEHERFRKVIGALLGKDDIDDAELLADLFSSDKPRSHVMLGHMIVSDEALRQRLHRAREKFVSRMEAITTEAERALLQGGRATIDDWERIIFYRAESSQRIQNMGRTLSGMERTLRRVAVLHRNAMIRKESDPK